MKTDLENLENWHFLFQLEGSLCGKVRDVFDQSVQRLVDTIHIHRVVTEGQTEDQVRRIMMARLPLFGMTLDHLRETYAVLASGARFQKTGPHHEMEGACVLACQVLRVGPDVTADMQQRIFVTGP